MRERENKRRGEWKEGGRGREGKRKGGREGSKERGREGRRQTDRERRSERERERENRKNGCSKIPFEGTSLLMDLRSTRSHPP